MKKNTIVAVYDYYTLEEKRQIKRQEERQKARQKRIEQVEQQKGFIITLISAIIYILGFMWLAFGY